MTPDPSLGQAARGHVQALAEGIGPRPAGSEAERRAFDYVAGQLSQWGYTPERLPVRFAPVPRFFALYALGGLALALGGWGLPSYPGVALALPLMIIALPQIARWLMPLRPRTASSENLVTYTSAAGELPTLILCAHLDSARAHVMRQPILLWLQSQTLFVALRVALAVGALALLELLGLPLPAFLVVGVAALGSVVGAWWMATELLNQLAWRGAYSPGAHDNASGVGVVLALAEYFARQIPGRVRLGFLFTGAEETGMHGAMAFAERLGRGSQTRVMNFDMVGAGDSLRFVSGDGTLQPLRADARLNALIQAAQPNARPLWYTLRSGDFLPFLRRGIGATSLQTSGSARAEQGYHTVYDTMDVIETTALNMTAQAARQVIGKLAGPDGQEL
jgi:hypothetical protein